MILVAIFSIVFCIVGMALVPVVAQNTANQGINDKNFRRIKIKRFKFLFKAFGGESVEKHGIIISMLVIQIFGYCMSLLSIIATLILLILLSSDNKLKIICITLFIVLAFVIITYVCVNIATMIVSKRIDDTKTKK